MNSAGARPIVSITLNIASDTIRKRPVALEADKLQTSGLLAYFMARKTYGLGVIFMMVYAAPHPSFKKYKYRVVTTNGFFGMALLVRFPKRKVVWSAV